MIEALDPYLWKVYKTSDKDKPFICTCDDWDGWNDDPIHKGHDELIFTSEDFHTAIMKMEALNRGE